MYELTNSQFQLKSTHCLFNLAIYILYKYIVINYNFRKKTLGDSTEWSGHSLLSPIMCILVMNCEQIAFSDTLFLDTLHSQSRLSFKFRVTCILVLHNPNKLVTLWENSILLNNRQFHRIKDQSSILRYYRCYWLWPLINMRITHNYLTRIW